MSPYAAIDTKVFLKADGSAKIVGPPLSDNYEPGPGEHELMFVRDIVIRYPLGDAVKAEIELFPHQDVPVEAFARPYLLIGGEKKFIEWMAFADGTEWHIGEEIAWIKPSEQTTRSNERGELK